MIIKSLSQKHGAGADTRLRNLVLYIVGKSKPVDGLGEAVPEKYIVKSNLRSEPNDFESIQKEFIDNKEYSRKSPKQNLVFHDIISFHKDELKVDQEGKKLEEKAYDLMQEYIALRCGSDSLVLGAIHVDEEHVHCHVMISGNKIMSSYQSRISDKEFDRIKKEIERIQMERYPELTKSVVQNRDNLKKQAERFMHEEFLREPDQEERRKPNRKVLQRESRGKAIEQEIKRFGNKPKTETLREMVLEALSESQTEAEFQEILKEDFRLEYYVRNGRPTIKDFDTGRAFRFGRSLNIDLSKDGVGKKLQKWEDERDKAEQQQREKIRLIGNQYLKHPEMVLEKLTYHQSVFMENDLITFLNKNTVDEHQCESLRNSVMNCRELVMIDDVKQAGLQTRYTTLTMQRAEKTMLADAAILADRSNHQFNAIASENVLKKNGMTEEQERAFRHVIQGGDLSVVSGFAGTGKSYLLKGIREYYALQGYEVKGACLSAIAGQNLTESSGIEAQTIHSMLNGWDKNYGEMNNKTVLVVDEMGMVGTIQSQKVLDHAVKTQAKVILIGDHQQLQPIQAGGALRGIIDEVGHAELTEVQRQESEWMREATQNLAGDREAIKKAIRKYRNQKCFKVGNTMEEAKARLINEWADFIDLNRSGKQEMETAIILAHMNADVRDMNIEARAIMKERGYIGENDFTVVTRDGQMQVSEGDQIMCMKNNYELGLKNGSLAKVLTVKGHFIDVELASGEKVRIDNYKYQDLALGYVSTIHKSQGVTADRCYVLASRNFDKHLAYVSMSRHKNNLSVYFSRDKHGFHSFEHLEFVMSRERPKKLIRDYENRPDTMEVDFNDVEQKVAESQVSEIVTEFGKPAMDDELINRRMEILNEITKETFHRERERGKRRGLRR